MKYRFICAIFNLGLEKDEAKITLPSGYISNEKSLLSETFENDLSLATLGLHSSDEIRDAKVYYVIDGDFGNEVTQEEADTFGTSLTLAYLRQIQLYIARLWTLRDNCVYVRDGFLYTYTNCIADGCTFKASVSSVDTLANGEQKVIAFTDSELAAIGKDMVEITLDEVRAGKDFYHETQYQYYKGSGISKKELGIMYVRMARSAGAVPMKLLLYCTAMESLVANTTTELSHRVAERVAVLIGRNCEERCDIYTTVKKGYDTRSKVAHGDSIKGDEESLAQCSVKIDTYLRRLLELDEPYEIEKVKIDQYYLEKLMS